MDAIERGSDQFESPKYTRTTEIETGFDYGCTVDERYEAETNFALQCAGIQFNPGDRILDIACGIGKHANLMREKTGCEVDAFDKSETLIEEANALEDIRKRQSGIRQAIRFNLGHMGDIAKETEAGRKYKLITILGDSFIYLPNEEAIRNAFQQYFDLLEPGGRLVLQFRGRGPNYQEESPEKDAMRARLGIVAKDYITKATYGKKPAGSSFELMADETEHDGVFYYMVAEPDNTEGPSHYEFGRVYIDPDGNEHNLGTSEIADFRSSEEGRKILTILLTDVGFEKVSISKAQLANSDKDMIVVSAGKAKQQSVSTA